MSLNKRGPSRRGLPPPNKNDTGTHRLNNPMDYEEVGLDLNKVNPGSDMYENSDVKMAGNNQSRGAEYEMVNQCGVGEDNHVYTSLNN